MIKKEKLLKKKYYSCRCLMVKNYKTNGSPKLFNNYRKSKILKELGQKQKRKTNQV